MKLMVVEQAGFKLVEGVPDREFMSSIADTDRVIEACLSAGVRTVLLYAQNLTPAFFDLSSGEAGWVLQKLRNYSIRLAVVCAPDRIQFSNRFGEMVTEERRRSDFGVFDSRDAAREWLGQ